MDEDRHSVHGVRIDDDFVAALLTEQAPQYAHLEVGRYYWMVDAHVTVRLGDTHALRLPRVPYPVDSYTESLRWLRSLSRSWTFTTQLPEFVGEPALGFPYPWEVVPWLEGATALRSPLEPQAALNLGLALREIHQPAPSHAPHHPTSSLPLVARQGHLEIAMDALRVAKGPADLRVNEQAMMQIWNTAVSAAVDTPRCWIHGNLDPRLVISDNGRFAGLIDWTNFAQGDPAVDLGYAGVLGGPEHIDRFLGVYNPLLSDATIARSRGICAERSATYALSNDPQLAALGWQRLRDLGLTLPTGDGR